MRVRTFFDEFEHDIEKLPLVEFTVQPIRENEFQAAAEASIKKLTEPMFGNVLSFEVTRNPIRNYMEITTRVSDIGRLDDITDELDARLKQLFHEEMVTTEIFVSPKTIGPIKSRDISVRCGGVLTGIHNVISHVDDLVLYDIDDTPTGTTDLLKIGHVGDILYKANSWTKLLERHLHDKDVIGYQKAMIKAGLKELL